MGCLRRSANGLVPGAGRGEESAQRRSGRGGSRKKETICPVMGPRLPWRPMPVIHWRAAVAGMALEVSGLSVGPVGMPGCGLSVGVPAHAGSKERVEAASFGGGGEGSGVGEHVLRGGDDGVGARGSDFDPVGEVETAGDEVGDGLFGVLWAERGKESVEAGEVAGDGDGVDAGVEGAEKGGHGAAAGAAEGSDAVGVDFRAREQGSRRRGCCPRR